MAQESRVLHYCTNSGTPSLLSALTPEQAARRKDSSYPNMCRTHLTHIDYIISSRGKEPQNLPALARWRFGSVPGDFSSPPPPWQDCRRGAHVRPQPGFAITPGSSPVLLAPPFSGDPLLAPSCCTRGRVVGRISANITARPQHTAKRRRS